MYDILKSIIYSKAQLKNFNSSDNSFFIKETDRLAKCKRVDLLKFESKDTFFSFELDSDKVKCGKAQKISPFFENKKGLDKGNDAIIFTTLKEKQYIFICELKDGGKPRDFIPQFKSSKCFIDYLKSILKTFHNINIDNITIKYIVFSTVAKQLTATNGKYISTPQNGFDVFHINCSRKKYYIESFI